jgi:hypothetical protein
MKTTTEIDEVQPKYVPFTTLNDLGGKIFVSRDAEPAIKNG